MISHAILITKIYARLQEIASNFSKFSGGGPQTPRRRSVRSFAPYRAPLSKIPGSAPAEVLTKTTKKRKVFLFVKASEAEICTRVRRRYLTSFAGLHFEN